MKRDWIIFLLAGFFAGVAVRSIFYLETEFAFLLVVLGAALGAVFYFRLSSSVFILYAAIFALSAGMGVLRYNIRDDRSQVTPFLSFKDERIIVSGYVSSWPEAKEKYVRTVFISDKIVSVPEIAVRAKILVTLPHYPEVNYGDRLLLKGVLRKPENLNDFDWESYLARDNIYFEMLRPEIVSIEPGGGVWIKRVLFSVKKSFLENLSRVLPEPANSLLAGITAGESVLSSKLESDLRKVGVIHIIVLSGYNISIVAEGILGVLKTFLAPGFIKIFIASSGIIIFTIMTGASPSIVRAAVMGILIVFARQTGRIYDALSALFFAAFVMIWYNPKILRFDPGFQLSFMATLGLILLTPLLEKRFRNFPTFLGFKENFLATISTQIFVLPLILKISGMLSTASIPANLLILPTVPLAMFFGALTGFSGYISHALSVFFSWFSYALLSYELWVVDFFAKLSFSAVEIPALSALSVSAIYIIVALWVMSLSFKNEKKI